MSLEFELLCDTQGQSLRERGHNLIKIATHRVDARQPRRHTLKSCETHRSAEGAWHKNNMAADLAADSRSTQNSHTQDAQGFMVVVSVAEGSWRKNNKAADLAASSKSTQNSHVQDVRSFMIVVLAWTSNAKEWMSSKMSAKLRLQQGSMVTLTNDRDKLE
jgi:hypothetical protein